MMGLYEKALSLKKEKEAGVQTIEHGW